MGTIIAAIIIIALIIYTIKDLLKINDISMWINMLLTTIVLFTVILSIFIILHKNKPNIENNPAPQPMATQQEMANSKPERTQPSTSKQETPKNNEDLNEEDLMVSIAEEYLTAKYDYEKANPGKTGDDYAKNAIVKKYGLTESEWADFYEESLAKGYFKKAEANLKNRTTDYLISK